MPAYYLLHSALYPYTICMHHAYIECVHQFTCIAQIVKYAGLLIMYNSECTSMQHGQQVSSNLFVMHLPCMQLRAIYALQSIHYRSGAVTLSCTILSCIMLNSLIADYDSIIGSCTINRMHVSQCMHARIMLVTSEMNKKSAEIVTERCPRLPGNSAYI